MKDTKQELMKLIEEEKKLLCTISEALEYARFYNDINRLTRDLKKEQSVKVDMLDKIERILGED